MYLSELSSIKSRMEQNNFLEHIETKIENSFVMQRDLLLKEMFTIELVKNNICSSAYFSPVLYSVRIIL